MIKFRELVLIIQVDCTISQSMHLIIPSSSCRGNQSLHPWVRIEQITTTAYYSLYASKIAFGNSRKKLIVQDTQQLLPNKRRIVVLQFTDIIGSAG